MSVKHKTVTVNGHKVFYREAGPAVAPTILLLHGFPSSSHMYRDLIPHLEQKFHLVAPDLLGFGQSDMPSRDSFNYTFDNLADIVAKFTEVIGLTKFAIYIFDYGAPVGLRVALKHPDRITAIISQNGNAYKEGLSDAWDPIRAYWNDATPANREALRMMLTPQGTRFQYLTGVVDKDAISPDGWSLDDHYLSRPGMDEAQLDLFRDYATNVELYPQFQEYFRKNQPPMLAVWGKNDPFFLPAGAEGYARDMPKAVVRFFDTGHFALETHAKEIGEEISNFLSKEVV